MKVCPKCNMQLDDDSVFCTGCGQKIEEGSIAQAPNVCRNCGNPLSADLQFCTKCGTPVSGTAQNPQQATPTPTYTPPVAQISPTAGKISVETGNAIQNFTKNPAMLIGGILLFVLVIGGFLYFGSATSAGIPKTADDFVRNFNHVIKDIAQKHGADAEKLVIEKTRSGELGTFADFAGNKIMFFGGKNDNGLLSFSFMIDDTLESGDYFATMEGLIKASGGDVKQVMTGLGILSGTKYNIPANYEKEFMYDGKLNYSVSRAGLAPITRFSVEIWNEASSKPSSSNVTGGQQSKPNQGGSDASSVPAGYQAQPKYVDPMKYVDLADQYNREISALATDINNYLSRHANFQKDRALLSRAEKISRQIFGTKEALRIANIKDVALKQKLSEVFEALQGRADGLLDGVRESKNGGDYTPGFNRGGDAFDRFEEADKALKRMLR